MSEAIIITVTPATLALSVSTGQLVAGNVHSVTVRLSVGSLDVAHDYRLTLKRRRGFSEAPLAVTTTWAVSGADAVGELDLDDDDLRDWLDPVQERRDFLMSFRDDTDSVTLGWSDGVTVSNEIDRS